MKWHSLKKEEVAKSLQSSEKGLSENEVQKRLTQYGKNILKQHKKKSKFKIFLSQLNSLLIYILLIASAISFFIGHTLDASVILSIVFLNSIVGFIQEYKAEEIIEKLKASLKYKTIVLRNNKRQEIDSEYLVPGDIVLLESGDKILADCRILESNELQTSEAALSGESFPVDKSSSALKEDTSLADRKNMLYAGTSVVKGNAIAMIVETGNKTEFGKLAELVQKTTDEKMPLEKKVDKFSKKISIAILILVAIIFGIGIFEGVDKIEMMLVSISLAIGAIPEGLPAIIAITLAFAVKQMQKENTLIRKLPAAETLGRATVICTDKTGTLTEEELTVDKIYTNKIISLNSIKKLDNNLKQLFKIALLCNNARDENDNIIGDPTEASLIKAAKLFHVDKKRLTEDNPRVKEFPFNSNRKMMSIIRKLGKIKTSYVKGAPQFIIEKSTKEFVNGKIKLLTPKRKEELIKVSKELEELGLRTLGFGFRQITKISEKDAENHLIFTGLIGMIDPPREEVKQAIKEAIEAGIEIKIITGDSALTTKTIAKKLGLKGEVIEGRELDKIPEDKWDSIVKGHTIFARITPEQKLKVVETLKQHKQVVGVTGDGVNDILALKRADIGIAMGVRGSDVARDSSDMVLLDDNFASIVKAIKQGRRVFDNLKKSIKFLLAANIGEVFAVVAALLFKMPLIFLPLAILWMNLVTDSLPALALAVEPAGKNIMKRKPKDSELLTGIWLPIIFAGTLMVISSLLVFNYAMNNFGLEVARTAAITTAIFFELFFSISCKSENSIFKTGILNNKFLIYAILASGGLHLLAIYTPLGNIFEFTSLSLKNLGISIGAGLSGFVFFEIFKPIKKHFTKH